MTARWTRRPEESNWGAFGPDDQLGAMNLVGREQVLKGLAEAHAGPGFSTLAGLVQYVASHPLDIREVGRREGGWAGAPGGNISGLGVLARVAQALRDYF